MSLIQYSEGTSFVTTSWDTPSSVALRHGVGLDLLVQANPWMTPITRITPGTVVLVPFPSPPEQCAGVLARAESGDTLFTIAERHNADVSEVMASNPQVLDPNVLMVGQPVCVPMPPPAAPAVCKNGAVIRARDIDSLEAIAGRYGADFRSLRKANPQIKDGTRIVSGQEICVPYPPPRTCIGGSHAIVGKNETLRDIADQHGIALEQLMAANPEIEEPEAVLPGQAVCVPGKEKTPQEVLE